MEVINDPDKVSVEEINVMFQKKLYIIIAHSSGLSDSRGKLVK